MLPPFVLRDQRGTAVRASELAGKVVVLTFLETKCTEACPFIAGQIGIAFRRMSPAQRQGVTAVAISTHPGDDTPASVRAFLRRERADPFVRYLVGSERQLRPVWRAFQILPALDTGDADVHSAPVRIYDREGEWVSTLHAGVDLRPENLIHDVMLAKAS
jgi:protein SCO1/2